MPTTEEICSACTRSGLLELVGGYRLMILPLVLGGGTRFLPEDGAKADVAGRREPGNYHGARSSPTYETEGS
jgi:hypothetical protein